MIISGYETEKYVTYLSCYPLIEIMDRYVTDFSEKDYISIYSQHIFKNFHDAEDIIRDR